jgi:hypothetical protein
MGVWNVFKASTDIPNFAFILLGGVCLFVALQSVADVFQGKVLLEEVVSLPLPGRTISELSVPTRMGKGRLILFFQDTTERYAGKITLSKLSAHESSVSVDLPRLTPTRIRIPRWVPASDAGEQMETWSRRTGQSTEPVIMTFPFEIDAGEKLRLEFELDSNFKGTNLEKRFPVTGTETVRIIVKE